MNNEEIFIELKKYLLSLEVEEIKMHVSVPDSLVICMAITKIINTYNSTPSNERIVSALLISLLKNYFK